MSPEEPDSATAGTEKRDHDGWTRCRRHAVALAAGVAALTIAATVAVAALVGDGGSSARDEAATTGTSGVTVLNATGSTPSAGAPEDTASATPSAAASVPGVPTVSVGPAGPEGCPASWTVDDGGSPLVGYVVTNESAPVPPDPSGTEIGTALRAERTTATTGSVDLGGTIRVSAENALGSGPSSATLGCG